MNMNVNTLRSSFRQRILLNHRCLRSRSASDSATSEVTSCTGGSASVPTPHVTRAAPLSLTGWCFDEPRDSLNQIGCGAALLDGDDRTSWPHFGVPQQYALAGTLAFLKGGLDGLPKGVTFPPAADGRLACTLLFDVITASREASKKMVESGLPMYPEHTIFDRSYDLLVPLPSSVGPGASENNKTAAMAVSSAFSPVIGGDGGPPIEEAVLRVQKMKVKSTKTDRNLRKHRDAPRQLHFSNMLLSKALVDQIQGQRILLWDDVCTWGNTSEAARNLLLIAGASRVDVITAFSTGPVTRAHTYSVNENPTDSPLVVGQVGDTPDKNNYEQKASILVSKELIEWEVTEKGPLREWHEALGEWVEANFPHFVPNEIPF